MSGIEDIEESLFALPSYDGSENVPFSPPPTTTTTRASASSTFPGSLSWDPTGQQQRPFMSQYYRLYETSPSGGYPSNSAQEASGSWAMPPSSFQPNLTQTQIHNEDNQRFPGADDSWMNQTIPKARASRSTTPLTTPSFTPRPPPFRPNLSQPFQPNLPPPFQSNLPQPFQSNLSQPFEPNLSPPFQPHLPQPSQPNLPQPSQPNLPPPFQPNLPLERCQNSLSHSIPRDGEILRASTPEGLPRRRSDENSLVGNHRRPLRGHTSSSSEPPSSIESVNLNVYGNSPILIHSPASFGSPPLDDSGYGGGGTPRFGNNNNNNNNNDSRNPSGFSPTQRQSRLKPSNLPFLGAEQYVPRSNDVAASIVAGIAASRHQVTVIWGAPGNGKTTLALHVGERALFRDEASTIPIVNAVYFTSFEMGFQEVGAASSSSSSCGADVAQWKSLIAGAILSDIDGAKYEDPPRALTRYCQEIAAKNCRALFIFDNVEAIDGENSRRAFCQMAQAMIQGRNVHLLITSRNSTVCDALIGKKVEKIELRELDRFESMDFLWKHFRGGEDNGNEDDFSVVHSDNLVSRFSEICEKCQGNAMGLKLCAASLAEGDADVFTADVFSGINALHENVLERIIDASFRRLQSTEQEFLQAVSVFCAPFSAALAKKAFPSFGATENHYALTLSVLSKKSLVTKYGEDQRRRRSTSTSKYGVHPFIRSYCRSKPGHSSYRASFVGAMFADLAAVSILSFGKNRFRDARKRFLDHLPHYDNALLLVKESHRRCVDDAADDGDALCLEALTSRRDVIGNLSIIVNFLHNALSSALFYSFFVNVLDAFTSSVSATTGSFTEDASSLRVVIRSLKIRYSDFITASETESQIADTETLMQTANPSVLARAYFHYTHGVYRASNAFNSKKCQGPATKSLETAGTLLDEAKGSDGDSLTLRVLDHYLRMSIGIQKSKIRNNEVGISELRESLHKARECWGDHPITMEMSKGLADALFKPDARREQLLEALGLYIDALRTMSELGIGQEYSRVRLMKNKAACEIYLYHRDGDVMARVERDLEETRRIMDECQDSSNDDDDDDDDNDILNNPEAMAMKKRGDHLRYEVWYSSAIFYQCWLCVNRGNNNSGHASSEFPVQADVASTMELSRLAAAAETFANEAKSIVELEDVKDSRKFMRDNLQAIIGNVNVPCPSVGKILAGPRATAAPSAGKKLGLRKK